MSCAWMAVTSLRLAGRVSLRGLGLLRAAGWKETATRSLSISVPRWTQDKVTHTGQYWEKDDYRNVRFTDREKQVNEQFAIDLLAEEPVTVIKGNHTFCDGGQALGHPRVFINLDPPEIQDCGYCGRRFMSEMHKEKFSGESFTYNH